jgi:hypothetical protein
MYVLILTWVVLGLLWQGVAAEQACTPIPTTNTTVPLVITPPAIPTPATLLGYQLERQVDEGSQWTPVATLPPAVTQTTDGPLQPGKRYDYRLFAQWRLPSGEVRNSTEAPYLAVPPCYLVHTPPVISITTPTSQPTYVSDTSPITVGGTAQDDNGLRDVTWTCPQCTPTAGTAQGKATWTIAGLGLQDGPNVLTVTVTDIHGVASSDVLTITLTVVLPPPAGFGGVRD